MSADLPLPLSEQGVRASRPSADRVTDASHGAPEGSPPCGSVPTDAGHAPLPWQAHRYCGPEDNWFVRGSGDERVCGQGSGRVKEVNAAFIVRACNSHYELLEALAAVINSVPFHRLTPLQYAIWAKAGEAIAKATGDAQ